MKSFFVFFLLAVSAPVFAACSSTSVAHETADAGCAGAPLDCGDSTKCPWPKPVCLEGKWGCEAATIMCDADAGKANDAALSDGGCAGTPLDCGDSTKCPWPKPVCLEGKWGCEAATIMCDADAGKANDAALSDGGCAGTPLDCGDSTKCPWPSSVCINGTWGCEAATIACTSDGGDAAAHE